jgi:hypothetical protein
VRPCGGEPTPLEPGTRAPRHARFEREHPRLYAARHVIMGVLQVAAVLIGLFVLLRFLPSIPLADRGRDHRGPRRTAPPKP